MKNQSKLYIAIAIVITLTLGHINFWLRAPDVESFRAGQTGPDVVAQLDGLSDSLDKGGAERMQKLFPEGYVFTWALYGLSWVQVGLNEEETTLHHRAQWEARRAVEAIDSEAGRAPFWEHLEPSFGVFYNGWLAWLVGGVLLISEDPPQEEVDRFRELCDEIARGFRESPTPYLSSYPQASWPADSVVAVAALRLHDHLFAPRYERDVSDWLRAMDERPDPDTGLLPHKSDATSGDATIAARGSSQALMLRFLIDIDPQLAREHYMIYRGLFADSVLGMVPGVREYPHGKGGPSDVDSGPIILGYSGPATVVGMGAAIAYGDNQLSDPILRGVELVGLPVTWGGSKRYGFGRLPVGEAFLVWSKTARPWITAVPEEVEYEPVLKPWWLWFWHLPSVLMLLVVWRPVVKRYREQKRFEEGMKK